MADKLSRLLVRGRAYEAKQPAQSGEIAQHFVEEVMVPVYHDKV
ncbi:MULTISPECIES: hypothetical protein [Paraburkholderia]|nr:MULTISPECIES: hypothetical protein [Paraburkholderia]MCX4174518.1 hypothetical protein [Paraburkholderia madseniana]